MRLHSFFYIVNNQNSNRDDKLYKVRPLIHSLSLAYQKYYILNKEISIDEKMIKYTGRVSFLQYVQNKPTRLGFKVFVLSDALSGYVFNWHFYTGAGSQRTNNLARNIVVELVQGLEFKFHHVYFDSYYSSIELAQELAQKGFGCVGTINKRRRFLPQAIKNPSEPLQQGETLSRKLGNLVSLIHKDKREIRLITTIHGKQLSASGKPQALVDYNIYMRGIDKGNQNSAYYHNNHKSLKWWKTIFNSLIKVSINNAYILYKTRNPFTARTPLKFRERLVEQLIELYLREIHHQRVASLHAGKL